jgi:succinate dehydrogenase / fumarate reductase iron-sulfur subunit
MAQEDRSRPGVPQYIECFLCQDVCHVLRDHHLHDKFIGPRFLVYVARSRCTRSTSATVSRELKRRTASGSATSRVLRVCPEHITITDNAIIPLKERVVDRFYDPLSRLLRLLRR